MTLPEAHSSRVRSPLFNFLLGTAAGIVFGGCLATSIAVHTITAKAEADIRELGARNRAAMQNITDICNAKLQSQQDEFAHCTRGAQDLTADLQQRDLRDRFYTLVYEPASSPASAAPIQLLNLAQPGLGTILEKLQAPVPGYALRYVLHGYVKAEAMPQGVHLVYTLVQPVISTGTATQVQ